MMCSLHFQLQMQLETRGINATSVCFPKQQIIHLQINSLDLTTFGDVCHRFQTNMESISDTNMLICILLEKTSTYLTVIAVKLRLCFLGIKAT